MLKNLLFIILLFQTVLLQSQEIIMGKGNFTKTCKGQFFDSGGAKGNYTSGESNTMTICSDGSASLSHISLSFSGLELSQGDKLCFYDGPNTQSKLIVCNDNLPKVFIVQASAANNSGCLTIDFKSVNSKTSSGWSASVQCVPSCQKIDAEIVSTNPNEFPADTGWIDICPYESVQFDGNALFPQNGIKYNQNIQNSIFEWNFGDGNSQIGQKVQHTFSKSGGFIASLTVKDQLGCKNTNYIRKKIRVATAPNFNGKTPNLNYCIGDTIKLKANLNSNNKNANLNIIPNPLVFNPSGIRSDSLALPDGDGTSYKTSIRFTDFAPSSTLTNIADLQKIGVNMEHSWMRDLQISIECPNGQTAILHNYQGRIGKKIVLGQPIETDTIQPKPGKGFDYSWKYNASNDPWLQWANNNPSKTTLPSGDYRPYDSFSKLIGCPLNGDWSIIVQDLWSRDNGFIFNWSINFNPNLLPSKETFLSPISESKWEPNKSTIFANKDSLVAIANEAGTQSYKYLVTDAFGCTYDTTLNINILPPTNPLCKSCSSKNLMKDEYIICNGELLNLNASINNNDLIVPFSATPDYKFGYSNHPPSIPYISEIDVSNLYPLKITDITKDLKSICFDIESDYDNDLQIYLESPDGKILELTTNNGGSGKNYANTCFSPKANISIKNGIAPFNNDYLPEGNWSDLNNCSINGKWKLKVSDAFGAGIFGLLKSWKITFNAQNQYKYSWSPPTEISCTNCSNPNVSPSKSTNYIVNISDLYGCSFTDTVKVKVVDKIPAPILSIDTTKLQGTICVKWEPIQGISLYEVNINNTGWILANGILKHTLTNVQSGILYDIKVRAKNSNCEALPALIQAKYENCPINIQLDSILLPKCYNSIDACIYVHSKDDFGQVKYSVNGIKYDYGYIKNISAGQYQIIATDKLNCKDTIDVVIPKKDSILIEMKIDSIKCFGKKGSIFAQSSGGNGSLNIIWNTNPPVSNPTIGNLQKGSYTLTASDSKGCQEIKTVTLNEPPKISITPTIYTPKCYGGNDGKIEVIITGGTPNYFYKWNNDSINSSINNLRSGNYKLNIYDQNNCKDSIVITLTEPTKLNANLSASVITCKGGNSGTATCVASGGVPPYSYLWNDNLMQKTSIANNLFAGYYQLQLKDNNNCTIDTSIIVNENAEMQLEMTQIPAKCYNSADGIAKVSVKNGFGPFKYQWNDSKNQKDSIAIGLGKGLYVVTVTDVNGCKKVNTINVESPDTLKLTIQKINLSCKGINDGQATATLNGGINPYKFQWNDIANQQTAIANNLSVGTYIVTVSDSNNCKIVDQTTILPPQPIRIDSVIKIIPTCNGNSNGKIELIVNGGSGNYKYSWNDPLLQFLNPANNLPAGNFTVTITDNRDCKLIQTINLLEPEKLSATANASPVKCYNGKDGSIDLTVNGGTAPYKYFWDNQSTSEDLNNLTFGNYKVIVIDSNGCITSNTFTIAQPLKPLTASFNQYFIPCNGENAKCQVLATGGTGTYKYRWSSGEIADTSILLKVGNHHVTITDQNNCYLIDSTNIEEYLPINANYLLTNASCYQKNDGKIVVNNINGGAGKGLINNYKFIWKSSPNTMSYIDNLFAGTYNLTISDQQGCNFKDNIAITEPDKMQLKLEAQNSRCSESADGAATVLEIIGGVPKYTYTWDNNAQNQTIATAIGLKSGTYKVSIQDANGCQQDTFIYVGKPSKVQLDYFDTKPGLCDGDTLGQSTIYAKGGTPPYHYLWSNGLTTQTTTGLKSGFVTVTISDFYNCNEIATTQLKAQAILDAKLSIDGISCFGSSDGSISIEAINGSKPYKYSLDGYNFKSQTKFIGLKSGKYAVFVKDANGCAWVGDFQLKDPPKLIIDAGKDIEISFGDSVQLSANSTNHQGKLSFEWQQPYKSTLSCLFCEKPWAKPLYDIDYVVIATDSLGCEATDDVRIYVNSKSGVDVPTGFTPNGDNTNDRLLVHGVKGTKVLSFKIFDNWGEQLFEDYDFMVNDENRGWDGNFRSKAAPSGVYVWYLTVENINWSKKSYKGNVTLIR